MNYEDEWKATQIAEAPESDDISDEVLDRLNPAVGCMLGCRFGKNDD
jgi:hypothetical protein